MSDELKNLTVDALKDLARRHLGKGFSRLRTKAELLTALRKVELLKSAEPARGPAPRSARVLEAPKRGSKPARPAPAPSPPAQVTEGFFVVRVAGAAEAERHHLTESSGGTFDSTPSSAGYDEQLGELPDVYEDDAELLLPRDPHTLFFLWDYARDTRQGAMAGLHRPRARLRVYDGAERVREVDFALESGSYYIHGLVPGRNYRVEAYFLGEDGAMHRLGRGTNAVLLPREGPSDDLEVRFMRVPWDLPLSRIKELLRHLRDAPVRVAAPPRLPLPSSQASRPMTPLDQPGPPQLPLPPRIALPTSVPGGAATVETGRSL